MRLAADALAARVTVPLRALPFLLMLRPAVLKTRFSPASLTDSGTWRFRSSESRMVHIEENSCPALGAVCW